MEDKNLERLRLLAERILTKQDARDKSAHINDVKQILHELSVHQIELQIQNDELHKVQRELENSNDKYFHLFNHAPVCYFIIDENSSIIQTNETANEKFAIDQNDFQGMPFTYLVVSEERDLYYLHHRKLIHSNEEQVSELWFLTNNEKRFFARIKSTYIDLKNSKNKNYLIALTNISEHRFYQDRIQNLRKFEHTTLSTQSVVDIIEVVLSFIQQIRDTFHAQVVLFDHFTQEANIYSVPQADSQLSQVTKPLDLFKDLQFRHTEAFRLSNEATFLDDQSEPDHYAHLLIPIYQDTICMGYIDIASNSMDDFSEAMIEFSRDMVTKLNTGLQQARSYEDIHRYNAELEEHVTARTHQLQESERSEHEHRLFAEALLEITRQLNASLDLDEILEHILINLERVVSFDGANIVLIENDKAHIAGYRGFYPKNYELLFAQDLFEHRFVAFDYMQKTHKPIIIANVDKSDEWVHSVLLADVKSYLGIPILSRDKLLGFINVDKFENDYFTERHIERLQAFAEQVAIAINNAHHYQQGQQVAILEERQRLARDLHDAVSQVLFILNITAESLEKKIKTQFPDLQKYTNMISVLSSSAQSEMRLLLLELRPMNMLEVDLKQLLGHLVAGLRGRKDIDVSLQIDTISHLFDAQSKNVFFRITQEALNNVSKHSNATSVSIMVQHIKGDLVLEVQDNGIGIDTNIVPNGGHGLSIMRERAESIGATFIIESGSQQGTLIKIIYPYRTKLPPNRTINQHL